jgi:hypothetical protein
MFTARKKQAGADGFFGAAEADDGQRRSPESAWFMITATALDML